MEQRDNKSPNPAQRPPRPRRQRLRLPFDNRREDFASWVYDNRIGLCITTIALLTLAIVFVISRIDMSSHKGDSTIYIDFAELERLEQERDRLEEEVRRRNEEIDWNKLRNLSSNENALNENLQDEKNTNTSDLNDSAEAMERDMQANRQAYEDGLREVDAIGENRTTGDQGKKSEQNSDVKRGNVMVSFSFTDPVRYSRHLIKPAYRCEGGGEVIVSAVLNQSGNVVSATIVSGGDDCMRRIAREAALGSRFNFDSNAPSKQEGTITYIFVPQY